MTRLAAAVIVTAALCAGPGPAAADSASTAPTTVVMAKKHRAFAAKLRRAAGVADADHRKKSWRKHLDRQIGKKPPKLINIYNGWTHEYVAVRASTKKLPLTADDVNRFLRCRFTNEPTAMDSRLFGTLVAAAKHFRAARVNIVSAYRSPKYNLMLRKKGRQVARTSQHTKGNAVDFRIPGISTKRLHKWAVDQRLGGVGKYLGSEFIHMDTDRIRYWEGR